MNAMLPGARMGRVMTEKEIRVSDGTVIFAWELGNGDPVLLIHGAAVDSSFWEPAARLLARKRKVIAFDRRIYGRSYALPGVSCAPAHQADDARTVLDAFGIDEPCDVIAHSAGCHVALELAAAHRDRVQGMLLHEPPALDCLPADDDALKVIADAMEQVEGGLFSLPAFEIFGLEFMTDERAAPQTPVQIEAFSRYAETFLRHEASEIYRHVADYQALAQVPAAVGLGELSRQTYHARSCPELARRLHAPLVPFPGGHNCPRELPWAFASEALGLLALL